jgi:hypothetical protein
MLDTARHFCQTRSSRHEVTAGLALVKSDTLDMNFLSCQLARSVEPDRASGDLSDQNFTFCAIAWLCSLRKWP